MKASVLVATHDKALFRRVQAATGDVCRAELSVSPGQTYDLLMRKPFQAVVVDARLPEFDSLAFVHALRHASPGVFVMTWGYLAPVVYWTEPKTWDSVVIPRSVRSAVEILRARLDPAAGRTIQEVRYQQKEDTFFVAFRNRKTYELDRKVIEADDGSPIEGEPRVIHGGEAFGVRQKSGNTYQVAWDFVLYYQEPAYPYFKGRAGQQQAEGERAVRIGARIRQEREVRGMSLGDLAARTGIHAPNLSRLESGKHVPSLETLERVAEALGVRAADLVAA